MRCPRSQEVMVCEVADLTRTPALELIEHHGTRVFDRQSYRLPCHLLHGLRQCADLGAVLLIGGSDQERQQMAQGIHRHRHLTTFAPPGSIIASMLPTFGGRLQRPTSKDRRRGLPVSALRFMQQQSEIAHQRLEATRGPPPLRLLRDNVPGRQVIGHHPRGECLLGRSSARP
jgi:hypothetical protein